jgi:hypothetical protein
MEEKELQHYTRHTARTRVQNPNWKACESGALRIFDPHISQTITDKIRSSLILDGQLFCHLFRIHGTNTPNTRHIPTPYLGFVLTPVMKVAVNPSVQQPPTFMIYVIKSTNTCEWNIFHHMLLISNMFPSLLRSSSRQLYNSKKNTIIIYHIEYREHFSVTINISNSE